MDDTLPDQNPLSEREMEVARQLATGASNAEIARELIISPHTVKVHVRNIYEKLSVSSRTEATMLLVQQGWLIVPGATHAAPLAADQPAAPPPPPPEPEPLVAAPPQVQPWQRALLGLLLLLALFMVAYPFWQAQARTSAPLLTDAGLRNAGSPSLSLDARWGALTPLQPARSRHATTRVENHIFVIGGEGEAGAPLRRTDLYDITANRWESLAPLPTATSNLAAAAIGNAVYVAGGTWDAAPSDNAPPVLNPLLWRLDIDANTWESLGEIPVPVAGAALAASEDTLYLVGGWDGVAMRDEIWAYTPAAAGAQPAGAQPAGAVEANWELVGRIAAPRAFMGAVVVNQQLYVVGGFDGQRELARVDVFDLAEARWRALPPMAAARSGFSLVYDGIALVALGGGWLDSVTTHERFDPTSEVWSNFPSPLSGSWRHLGAASLDGQIYLMGGWSGGYLDANVQYQSTFRALLPVITGP